MLQVESYGMDVILQIFKMSVSLGTLFFESLAKKLLVRQWMIYLDGWINMLCLKMMFGQPPNKFWL